MIQHFNYATPGREAEGEDTVLINKKEYKEKTGNNPSNPYIERAQAYLEGLGGSGNIEDMTSCATRLRVTVKDPEKIASDSMFKANKAVGVVRHGKAIQVIVGLDVAQVLEKMQDLSSGPISTDVSEQPTVKELTPIQQNATLVMDSLGMNQNIENVEDVGGKLLVTVVNPAEVDNEQIFKDLSLGIEKVVLDGKRVTISMPNHEKYVQAILSLI